MGFTTFHAITLGLWSNQFVAAAPALPAVGDRCTNGVPDLSRQKCCPRSCGTCGGVGCDTRPGGGAKCCGHSMTATCTSPAGPPPCSYPAGWDWPLEVSRAGSPQGAERCTSGVLDSSGMKCCARECGTCGGIGCDARPGGSQQCCGSSMKNICASSAGPPPCSYPHSWSPPPSKVDSLARTRCIDGILDSKGEKCCSRKCGACGGTGCDERPGGGSHCCGFSILAACSSLEGPPPCFYPTNWSPPSARCTAGVADSSGQKCCSKECGACGGTDCDTRPGGGKHCCGSSIKAICRTDAGPPPCSYSDTLGSSEL